MTGLPGGAINLGPELPELPDPATLAQQKLFARLRERCNRALLKRRRQKSEQ